MSTEIAKNNSSPLAKLTPEQIELIKSQIAPKANKEELGLFIYQAERTGLNPLARQIYAIHRGNKMTIQVSIDGFRVIAERSGDYGGQDEPVYVYDNNKLIAAKVTVYRFRGDIRYPAATGVAHLNEFKPGENMGQMWNKMPHVMLAKVAEAQALRKAYPQDLSGLYTNDEMSQAEEKDVTPKEPEKMVSKEQVDRLIELDSLFPNDNFLARCLARAKVTHADSLTEYQALKTLESLEKKAKTIEYSQEQDLDVTEYSAEEKT